jgi:ribosomal protein S6
MPLVKGTKKESAISRLKLRALADEINDARNGIVHRGEFRNEKAATKTIETTRRFVQGLVRLYKPHFTLHDQTESPTSDD